MGYPIIDSLTSKEQKEFVQSIHLDNNGDVLFEIPGGKNKLISEVSKREGKPTLFSQVISDKEKSTIEFQYRTIDNMKYANYTLNNYDISGNILQKMKFLLLILWGIQKPVLHECMMYMPMILMKK